MGMQADSENISDETLMRRIRKSGDEAACAMLVERYTAPALALADTRLQHTGRSEDAVQETFLKTLNPAAGYNPSRPFAPWFYTILRNICTDYARRESRYRQKLEDLASHDTPSQPSGILDGLDEGLAKLKDDERDTLILRLVQGLSFRAIAETLGCTEDAAKKRGQRALRRLRQLVRK